MNKLQQYFDQYLNGRSAKEICSELDITESYFRNILSINNIIKTNRKIRKDWTLEELEYLKNNYINTHISDICKYLNRPEICIRTKANRLNIYKTSYIRKQSEYMKQLIHEKYLDKYKNVIDEYKLIYKNFNSYVEIAEKLNIRLESLRNLRRKANLPEIKPINILNINDYLKLRTRFKNILDISNHFKVSPYIMSNFITSNNLPKPNRPKKYGIKWTTTQINKLKFYYKDHTAKECAELLDRSFDSIKWKLKELNIKK